MYLKNGILNGIGRTIYENGNFYYGSFSEGKFNGSGIYYNSPNNIWSFSLFKDNIL